MNVENQPKIFGVNKFKKFRKVLKKIYKKYEIK